MKWNFNDYNKLASSMNLILERETKGYTLTDNSQGVTSVCKNLIDVDQELTDAMYIKLCGATT